MCGRRRNSGCSWTAAGERRVEGAVSGRDGGGHRASVLYAYSVYGAQGVVRAIQILKDELEMNMRLSLALSSLVCPMSFSHSDPRL